ncbi:uncharacterized protein METZ01_LOCUS169 [marine metagenome]|uniref:DUF4340 domain-containing protein n=1 Tax=marine metagenome TaxID=408172 RepID=A0A381MYI4_9ZZZZ|tara:strand:+ start:452 stop:1060 length:609 start_codon:yes stop_codon:yes gene_type:complete
MKILAIILGVIVILYFISQSGQKKHQAQSNDVFSIVMEEIYRFDVQKDSLYIALQRKDTTWQITGNDSLLIQANRINDVENKVLTIKRESVVSKKPSKWKSFNVDDSLGTKITFYDFNDEVLGEAIFGRSKSDWQRSYVRLIGEDYVYMTNENVINSLQMRPTFWGKKPPPLPEPAEEPEQEEFLPEDENNTGLNGEDAEPE